jgi:hypothetical protein
MACEYPRYLWSLCRPCGPVNNSSLTRNCRYAARGMVAGSRYPMSPGSCYLTFPGSRPYSLFMSAPGHAIPYPHSHSVVMHTMHCCDWEARRLSAAQGSLHGARLDAQSWFGVACLHAAALYSKRLSGFKLISRGIGPPASSQAGAAVGE